MAAKCLDEFNPWPSFVDIFSSVILVLLLFLLVLIVNIGYYAQFKFKVQYDGSIATDKVILTDDAKRIKVDVEAKEENKETDSVLQTTNMEKVTTQAMQEYLTAATDIESAGEDLADKKKKDQKLVQKILEKDRTFYIEFSDYKIHLQDTYVEKLKAFLKNIYDKNPNSKIVLSSYDPAVQLSLTVVKQVSLGRIISTKSIIKKFGYSAKNISLKLGVTPDLPEDIDSEYGLIIVTVK